MKETQKYYAKIGDIHHRFCAINGYAAQTIALERAACVNEVLHSVEKYEPSKHDEHFSWEQKTPEDKRELSEQRSIGSLITGLA